MMYNFIIKLLVLETVVVRVSSILNVRTELFTHADLAKEQWSPRDIALLKARMYLQELIPSMQVSESPKYVSSLLRYIRECFGEVNREAVDSDTRSVLNDALSDVIGGYLKTVALPVTKSVYYSGALPTQDALQIFKYYKDIKRHLNTRGKDWSNQVTGVTKTKNIRGARWNFDVMKIREPCKQLLYLKDDQQNLSMPMPSIDWNTRMMFVPLKDQPIVDLRSPRITPVLQKFHKVASACERSLESNKRHFQDTFEDWANVQVVPHLSDDDLYTAFKGILNLIDISEIPQLPEKTAYLSMRPLTISTNSIIILSILILEVICCIPTLLYLLKKKKSDVTHTLSFDRRGPSCDCYSHSSPSQNHAKVDSVAEYFNYKKYNSDLSSISGTRRSYSSITDAPTVIDEVCATRKYSNKSNKKVQPSNLHTFHYQQTETDRIAVAQGQTQVSDWALSRSASKNTAINFEASSIKDLSNTTVTVALSSKHSPDRMDKSASKAVRKSKPFRRRHESPTKMKSSSPLTYSQCTLPLVDINYSESNRVLSPAEELKQEIFSDKLWDKALSRMKSDRRVEFASPRVSIDRICVKNEVSGDHSSKTGVYKKESIRAMKVLQGQDNIFEVTKATSVLDVHAASTQSENCGSTLKNWKGILKGAEEKTVSRITSKIPKRISNPPCETTSPRTPLVQPSPRHKSYIPTRKRAFDDSSIFTSSPRQTSLNTTL